MVKRTLAGWAVAAAMAWPAAAQCVMCFRTAQAQQSARARVLDVGIVVLGVPPFLILAGLLVVAVRRNERYRDE